MGHRSGASRAPCLTTAGFTVRRGHPGSRTNYYRIEDDAWLEVLRRRVATLAAFKDIAREGTERAARMRAAHATFEWLDHLLAAPPGAHP